MKIRLNKNLREEKFISRNKRLNKYRSKKIKANRSNSSITSYKDKVKNYKLTNFFVINKKSIVSKSKFDLLEELDLSNNDVRIDDTTLLSIGDSTVTKSKKVSKNKTNTRKRTKVKTTKTSGKKVALYIMGAMAAIGLIIALILFSIFLINYKKSGDVTNSNFYLANTSVNIYDRNGDYVNSLSTVNSEWIDLCKEGVTDCGSTNEFNVSQYYIDALIDTEDKNYWSHGPVNVVGLVKATLLTLSPFHDGRGGSTLTMQLAKLLYMDDEWVFTYEFPEGYEPAEGELPYNKAYYEPFNYKFTQMSYAIKIFNNFSKEEILENLINIMFFGNNQVGIENASQYYFGVSATELDLLQGATLAGITNAPSDFDPYLDPEASQKRRDEVLLSMLNNDTITKEEYDAAIATPLSDYLIPETTEADDTNYAINEAYMDLVYAELYEIFDPEGTGDFDPSTAGFEIYTSLDPEVQKSTYDAINNTSYYDDELQQSGTASVDTQNGEVLAIGGGRNQTDPTTRENYGMSYYRQPGSTAKPVTDYAPAIEFLGWSTAHQTPDKAINYTGTSTSVNNYDMLYQGNLAMANALAGSRNTTALYAFQQTASVVGSEEIRLFLEGLGFTDTETINEAYAIGGWTVGTTPLEVAGAYAAFANGGIYNEPHAITKIVIDPTSPYYKEFGAEYIPEYETHRAMKEETAFMITKMLDPNAYGSLTTDANFSSGGTLAAKSGTSNWAQNSYGIEEGTNRDKWLAGYTPDVATAVWFGYPGELEAEGYAMYGSARNPQWIFKQIMENAYNSSSEYLHDDTYTQPSNVVATQLVRNVWPPTKSSSGQTYYFIKGTSDYDALTTVPVSVVKPKVKASIDGEKVLLSWDYSGDYRNSSTWEITVDSKVIDKVDTTSYTIPFSKIATKQSCNATYSIGVKLIEDRGAAGVYTSSVVKSTLDISGTSYCKKVEPEVDPNLDTDSDGIIDTTEVKAGTDPKKADTDGDGLSDKEETTYKTDPLNADTDGDTVNDKTEITNKTDPLNADSDGDGLSDEAEITSKTDPLKVDSDNDGVSDFDEVKNGSNPLDPASPPPVAEVDGSIAT